MASRLCENGCCCEPALILGDNTTGPPGLTVLLQTLHIWMHTQLAGYSRQEVREAITAVRNKSVNSCTMSPPPAKPAVSRWTNVAQGPRSGPAVLRAAQDFAASQARKSEFL